MLAVIRTCPKRAAHCRHTIENLMRSNGERDQKIIIHSSTATPNQNGIACIRAGMEACNGNPFLFLEDDVEFIANFDLAAEQFFRDCQGIDSKIIPLCAAYGDQLRKFRGIAWPYKVNAYYGSQAFIITCKNAADFLIWTETQKIPTVGFDLLLKRWAIERGAKHFLTPYLAFVQHMGVDSAMHNGRFHFYDTWPGPNWNYVSSAFSPEEQTNRPCDLALVDAIAKYFDATLPAYDYGCSTGKYVRELRKRGIQCTGFDATPGIAAQYIAEVDLSRPQRFEEPQGNVMCLEVAEHIAPEKEKILIDNIRTLATNKLVLSWAVPGQGGRRHVNERPRDYVIPLIEGAGYRLNVEETVKMRETASIQWFKQTLYAFARKTD